ncbi:uncharacterized protein TNCV_3136621 [Trichonephila clavipes]|nr:uncharacterized protein TNCV_3136621 [Trichonephila clavipes]
MFETPMIWREPQNDHDDCYFYAVKINGINPGNRNKWSYPNLSSAQRPQLKSREVQPSTSKSSNDRNPCDPERNTSSENSDSDYKFSQEFQPFNQKELSDLHAILSKLRPHKQRWIKRLADLAAAKGPEKQQGPQADGLQL